MARPPGSKMKMNERGVQRKLKRFGKSFRPYEKKLACLCGEDSARLIADHARREYESLLPQTPIFPGTANIFNWVMGASAMMVAFHRAMKANGMTVEDTVRILFRVTEDSHRSIPAALRWVAGKFLFSRVFFQIVRRSAEKVHNHPDGWKIDYQRGDGRTCDWYFECHECGVIKYFRRHGVEELGRYCNYVDFIQSRAFGMGMLNPKNIGQGDEICCEYMKRGRDTVMPDNLKKLFESHAHQPLDTDRAP